MAVFKSLVSRHNLKEPSGFFTGTIELIHPVYPWTSLITPSSTSLVNSALQAGLRLAAT